MKNELITEIIEASGEELDRYTLIYILTKIRKIIELEGSRDSFKVLNLYCNWALHSKICDTQNLIDLGLFSATEKIDIHINFMIHKNFFTELTEFCNDYLDSQQIVTQKNRSIFIKILQNELSDTPLLFEKQGYRFMIERDGDDFSWTGTCL